MYLPLDYIFYSLPPALDLVSQEKNPFMLSITMYTL